ncbi:hypothetical protein J7J08_10825 [Stenotrophomonas sp. ISL-67]|uniref:hypothetical protein n=1 Tax=Stenotrophomonas sp. ISL-67 TaxID=2819171 RepID=UPI001BECA345|nr:hypothetical protein [Stenotrophomonas sp. ISL-67]MBT2768130.1 hypothetical protein [Stenotrophomonas sp. ISL-67]
MMSSPLPSRRKGAIGFIKDNPLASTGFALAAIYAMFGIIAGAHAHSPVPFWDMWDGALGFYMHQQTDPSAWWAQHNEHRIVLGRILFFTDLRFFGGSAVFLVAVNYILAAATFGLLAWCACRIAPRTPPALKITAAVILSLSFLWTQENNLTWGFQSQFFLAQLLPLGSLLLLWRSSGSRSHRTVWFAASLAMATVASGSMANGVLAGWLVLAGCVIGRQGWKRVLIALLVAIAISAVYFHGYVSPGSHGSLTETLKNAPRGVMWYLFAYLGSPFAHLVPGSAPNVVLAVACGAAIALSATLLTISTLLRRHVTVDLELVLALFLGYLGVSAFAIAGSRLVFGLDSAVASRYTTPALLALSCVLILGVAELCKRYAWARGKWAGMLLLIPLAFLPLQFGAMKHNPLVDFERVTAAMALEVGARDDEQILWTYPDSARVLEIASASSDLDLSVFARPWLQGARESIGKPYGPTPSTGCGVVPPVRTGLPNSNGWSRLQGGLVDKYLGEGLGPLFLLDAEGTVIGRGILAEPERQEGGEMYGSPFKLYAPDSRLIAGEMKVVVPGICSGAFNYK